MSDNEIYLLIKYIKSVLWRVAKCLSYIEEARSLKVNKPVYTQLKATLKYAIRSPRSIRLYKLYHAEIFGTFLCYVYIDR